MSGPDKKPKATAYRLARPRAPQWKIFTEVGLYMGSLHDPTDAAVVIANYPKGAQVRFGRDPLDVVWTQGVDGDAGESFDGAVERMFERFAVIRKKRVASLAETKARMNRADWARPGS